ncbi:hypothetical protein D3C87_1911810 [compost metagenome]
MPAASICQVELTVAELETELYLEYKEPPAQAMEPSTTSTIAKRSRPLFSDDMVAIIFS